MFKARRHSDIYSFDEKLQIYYIDNNELYVAKPLEFVKVNKGEDAPVTLSLSPENITQIAMSLLPQNMQFLEGTLEATKKHLEDMREIQSKLLEKVLKEQL